MCLLLHFAIIVCNMKHDKRFEWMSTKTRRKKNRIYCLHSTVEFQVHCIWISNKVAMLVQTSIFFFHANIECLDGVWIAPTRNDVWYDMIWQCWNLNLIVAWNELSSFNQSKMGNKRNCFLLLPNRRRFQKKKLKYNFSVKICKLRPSLLNYSCVLAFFFHSLKQQKK